MSMTSNLLRLCDVPRGPQGQMPIPADEYMPSYNGSALYLRNQWMLFYD